VVKLKWLAAVTVWYLVWPICAAHACQYNVREVGFIDVGIEPYRLIVYLPENTPAGGVPGLQEAMDLSLAETNVRFEPVTAGADANQTVMELAKTHGLNHFPAAVLLSPDGPSMPVVLPENLASLVQAVPSALGGLLDSPVRRRILEKCAEVYGVVLLIEGPDPQRNQAARAAVATAISRIAAQLDSLPKPIGQAPELVVLDRQSLAGEQMLLWTLRLKVEDANQPYAAVLYGRGRWIGPLFKGEILTADNLTQLLSMVGADCECSLDHHWLQGTMLPARWDEGLQEKVAQSVGFDPEDPMTKMAMVSIVRRGMGGSDYSGAPFDYREIQVGGDANAARGQRAEDRGRNVVPSSVFRPPSSSIVGQVLVGSLAGMVALAGITSLVVVLRARKP
jgi:hypothetical protein